MASDKRQLTLQNSSLERRSKSQIDMCFTKQRHRFTVNVSCIILRGINAITCVTRTEINRSSIRRRAKLEHRYQNDCGNHQQSDHNGTTNEHVVKQHAKLIDYTKMTKMQRIITVCMVGGGRGEMRWVKYLFFHSFHAQNRKTKGNNTTWRISWYSVDIVVYSELSHMNSRSGRIESALMLRAQKHSVAPSNSLLRHNYKRKTAPTHGKISTLSQGQATVRRAVTIP